MEQLSFEITAELNKLTKGLDRASAKIESFAKRNEKRFKDFGEKAGRIGQQMSIGLTLPLVALGTASVKAASDFEETESKFQTIFSSIRDEADKTAKSLRDSYGLSNKESLELLGNTGDLLTGFGFTQKAALDLSRDVNQLAVDLASFTNFSGGAKGASEALTKALLGERESVKSLGISILETDVQAKVLENTQKGLTFESNRQAKAFATLQIAQEQSKNAIGDYARTSGSFANQMRLLQSRVAELGVQFGQILLPLAQKLVKATQSLISFFSGLSKQTKTIIVVVGGLVAAMGPLLIVIGGIASALPTLLTGLALLTGPIGLVIAAIAALTAIIIANWDTVKKWANDIANYFIELYNESLVFKFGIEALIFVFKTLYNIAKTSLDNMLTIFRTGFSALGDVVKLFGDLLRDALIPGRDVGDSIKKFQLAVAKGLGTAIGQIRERNKKMSQDIGDDFVEGMNRFLSKNKIKPVDITISEESKKKIADDVAKAVSAGRAKAESIGSITGQGVITQPQDLTNANPIPNIITNATAIMGIELANMEARLLEFSENANNIIQNNLVGAFVGLGEVIGNALSGGGNVLQNVGQLILGTMGSLLTQLGQQAIVLGLTLEGVKKALTSFGGIGAIAVGTVAVALGKMFSNKAQSMGQSLGSGGGTGASVGGGGVSGNFSQSFSSARNGEIILRARGRDLVAVLNAQGNLDDILG